MEILIQLFWGSYIFINWDNYRVILERIEDNKVIYNIVPLRPMVGLGDEWYTKVTEKGEINIEDDLGKKYILSKCVYELEKKEFIGYYKNQDYTMQLIKENNNWVIDSYLYYDKRGR